MLTRTLVECGVQNIVIQPGILKSEKDCLNFQMTVFVIFHMNTRWNNIPRGKIIFLEE